jgi:spore germination cell wall hydrolase CwlJ-like protein
MRYSVSKIATWAIMSLCVIHLNLAEAKSKQPDMDPQLLCLAKNIYYEAGLESREGMIAVAQVTINRTQHNKFPSTICGVVNQKTEVVKPQKVTETEIISRPFWHKEQKVQTIKTVYRKTKICQFSWVCHTPAPVKYVSDRWRESVEVAMEVMYQGITLDHGYMDEALYFHNTHVRPRWGLERLGRIGGHIFYSDDPAPRKK